MHVGDIPSLYNTSGNLLTCLNGMLPVSTFLTLPGANAFINLLVKKQNTNFKKETNNMLIVPK